MSRPEVSAIRDFTATLGEGPLWRADEQALYWLDTMQRKIIRAPVPFTATEVRDLPYRPSCLATSSDGRLLIAYKKGLGLFDFSSGTATSLAIDGFELDLVSLNDGACDQAGRLWIGTRHSYATDPIGALYCIEPDLSVRRVAEHFVVSNGIAFSPDGRTMYHADSRPGRIDACEFDVATGTLSQRRVFLDYAGTERRPDGCTTDADGFLWVAEIDGWRVARYAPDGTLDRTIMLPVSKPSSVSFGGADLSTLFVTSIRHGLSEAELAEQPLAGQLIIIDTDLHGVPEPVFRGLETKD